MQIGAMLKNKYLINSETKTKLIPPNSAYRRHTQFNRGVANHMIIFFSITRELLKKKKLLQMH